MLMMNYASYCLITKKRNFFLVWPLLPNHCRYRELFLHLIATHSLWRTPLEEGSARRGQLYLTTRNIHTHTHMGETSMEPAGFEPALPVSERPQVLDCAATGFGINQTWQIWNHKANKIFGPYFSKHNIAMRQKWTLCSISLNPQFVAQQSAVLMHAVKHVGGNKPHGGLTRSSRNHTYYRER
jgi:hypothetical protein